MSNERRLILYIATSVDGYIAPPDEDLGFLATVQQEGEDYGYQAFTATVDTVLMGRRTYDKVAAMGVPDPHPGRTLYVITRTGRPSHGNIHFHTGDVVELVRWLRAQPGTDIYCDGGARLVHTLIEHDLIDRYCISVIPVLLGGGIRLFGEGRAGQALRLLESRSFPKGLVQSWYERVR
ncbi:MAG: dihydrofolate reductase [Flavobacteriales bacterium]|nr:dihydrofolate reductase [Flavobacteriales bacterium]MBL0036469.1 dihydrofolate reductase [Flavobacteriales bacterium]